MKSVNGLIAVCLNYSRALQGARGLKCRLHTCRVLLRLVAPRKGRVG